MTLTALRVFGVTAHILMSYNDLKGYIMKIWVAEVYTEAADTYIYLFEKEPTREYIVQRVWEKECCQEDYSFYDETLSIRIYEREVE